MNIGLLLFLGVIVIILLLAYGWRRQISQGQSRQNRYRQSSAHLREPVIKSNQSATITDDAAAAEVGAPGTYRQGVLEPYDDPDIILGIKRARPVTPKTYATSITDSSVATAPTQPTLSTEPARTTAHTTVAASAASSTSPSQAQPLSRVLLYLKAKPGEPFQGYSLLQALLNANLRLGEQGLFHCYQKTAVTASSIKTSATPVLFSVAAATREGTFDLSRLEQFSCPGLIFFLEPATLDNPLDALDILLDTMHQLSTDLDAVILDEEQRPLSEERVQAMKQPFACLV